MTTTAATPAPGVLRDLVTAAAEKNGVCVRPLIVRRTDNHTGQTKAIGIRCGTTRAQACRPCAERNRAIRMDQAREGWHLSDEPDIPAIVRTPSDQPRRVRSTRRRQDAPDLPKVPMATTTLGRTFDTPDGKTFRPSLFVTLTMPSYGKVGPTAHRWTRAATTTAAPPATRSTSANWSTGSGRTCAGPAGGRCSTSPPSNPRNASPRTSTRPSAAPCPAPSSGRSSPPPTTRSGGHRTTTRSTRATAHPSGTTAPAATSTRAPAPRSPPGRRRWTRSTTTRPRSRRT